MTFTLVKNHKFYITTESATAGLDTAVPGLYSLTPGNISGGDGIGSLGNIPLDISENEINLICNVIAFDPVFDRTDERVDLINGHFTPDSVRIKRDGTISLSLKKSNDVFAKIFDGARAGVNPTTGEVEIRDNDYIANNSAYGYRIVMYDGSKYSVFYHCEMTNYHAPPSNDKNITIVENMTFKANHYEFDVAVGDLADVEAVK